MILKRVAITGATGMIGAALVRECLSRGIEVTAFVRPNSSRVRNLPDCGGLLNKVPFTVDSMGEVNTSVLGEHCAFFHLAWVGSAPSERGTLYSQVENIKYALDAVELAHKLECSVFVGAGSQAEYGRVEGVLTPDTPAFPETGYGAAKLAAGQLSRIACEQRQIRHEWARILSVYGPGDASHTMVMSVIDDACSGRNPACTKGEQMWDYLYCDDCARALIAMAQDGKDGAVYPIGSGKQRKLSDFITEVCSVANPKVVPNFGARPYMDKQVMNLRADIASLERDTGYKPEVSFEDGIGRTVDWYRSVNGR